MSLPTTLVGRLAHHARTTPDHCAVATLRKSVSYAELAEQVLVQAESLERTQPTNASDGAPWVVGISCEEDLSHLIMCLALAKLSATSCTVPTHESPEQRQGFLQRAAVHSIIHKGGVIEQLESNETRPVDPILLANPGAKLLFSTSGTTGEPKIVCHSDAGIVAQAHRHVDTAERFACLAAMEHNFAKRHRLYCLAQGATNVILEGDVRDIVEQCQALAVTTLHLSAYQAMELAGVPGIGALRGLRLKLGGSHVPASLRELLRSSITGNLQCGYGTTETGAIGFTDPEDDGETESVGPALEGINVRIMGEKQASSEPGELAIRCEGMFLGYLGQPQLTAERLVDGWFHTGDVGYQDEHLRLHVSGRTDDMFVFNSINIYPQDIEAQIARFPSIRETVVLPQSSPVHGDIPVALVVPKSTGPLDLRELKRFVKARAGVRCPRRFVVVDSIPRNKAGKVDRSAALALLHGEQRP